MCELRLRSPSSLSPSPSPSSRSSRSIFLPRLVGIVLAAALGCGGDDDGGGDDNTPDAGDEPDAREQADAAVEMTRTGIVAVTETTVLNGEGPVIISGAVVSMNYVDDQSVTVQPVPGFTSNLNGCAITVFDLAGGDQPPAITDEGAFTVTGTANGDFECSYSDDAGEYVCQSTDAEIRGGVAGNAADATLTALDGTLFVEGAAFGLEMVGMTVELAGFGDADGVYPILDVIKTDTLVLDDFSMIAADATGEAGATFTTFVGAGPVAGFDPIAFLDDGTEDVVITKEDSALVPGFTVTAQARGEGFFLSKASDQPNDFPAVAADVTYACDGECGSDPAPGAGQLDAMVINGITTDVLPAKKDDDGFTMLPAQASFAQFACSAIGADADSVTIPEAGVEAILGTNPARIQITVGRFVAQIPGSATSNTAVLLGHSLTGFTTPLE
jgi:hypothetical protein